MRLVLGGRECDWGWRGEDEVWGGHQTTFIIKTSYGDLTALLQMLFYSIIHSLGILFY